MTEPRLTREGLLVPFLVPTVAVLAGFIGNEAIATAFLYLLLIGVVVACFGGSFRDDPQAFLSIVLPAVPAALAGLVRFPDPTGGHIAGAWLIAWASPIGTWIWPWWSRNILRRFRTGSPEGEMLTASRAVWSISAGPWTRESWDDAWDVVSEAREWTRPQTLPLHSALQSWLRVLAAGNEASTRRVNERWREEVDRLGLWVRSPRERARIDAERVVRPTRGTGLEYELPRLEALVAAGTEMEQRRMGAEAARLALRDVGLLTADREAALERAAMGALPREISERHEAAYEQLSGAEVDDTEEARQLHFRQTRGLRSLLSAIDTFDWPRDASDAVFDAVNALSAPDAVARLDDILAAVLGPERAAAASEVEAVPRIPRTPSKDGGSRSSLWAVQPSVRAVGTLTALAGATGAVAFVLAEAAHRLLPALPSFLVIFSLAMIYGFAIGTRIFGRRLDDADVWFAAVVMLVTLAVARSVVPATLDVLGSMTAGTGLLPREAAWYVAYLAAYVLSTVIAANLTYFGGLILRRASAAAPS